MSRPRAPGQPHKGWKDAVRKNLSIRFRGPKPPAIRDRDLWSDDLPPVTVGTDELLKRLKAGIK
jgi:hypothetical protein